ncbi:MAG: protein-disulfide reductase DsbD domain-containing protein [Paracoccaceae bacterium]
MIKILILIAALFPLASQAQESYGNVSFLNGWQLPDGSYQAAIDFDMRPGWKTYWRAPGPGGIPPSFDWQGSDNIADIEILWPTPEVFETYGLYSIGYTNHVTLPVRITPLDANRPVRINLQLDFGVCSDICVPASANFRTMLDASAQQGVADIKAALTQGPNTTGIKTATCTITPNAQGFDIKADLRFLSAISGDRMTVVEYNNPDVWIDIADTKVNGRDLTAVAKIGYFGKGMLVIDRSNIRITVLKGTRAFEITGCPAS